MRAMNDLKIGKVIGKAEAERRAAQYKCKLVPCRWVLTAKQVNDRKICRARCVAQQVASREPTASNLGISSNTPSLESFRSVIALAALEMLVIGCLDVSTAFLNSPLPARIRQIVRLPGDVSLSKNEYNPAYIDLTAAMNGLRVASKSWLQFASSILARIGVNAGRALYFQWTSRRATSSSLNLCGRLVSCCKDWKGDSVGDGCFWIQSKKSSLQAWLANVKVRWHSWDERFKGLLEIRICMSE